jgi:hypothetical protein
VREGSGVLYTPCCHARSTYRRIPAVGYSDRTCTRCMRPWRFTFEGGTWAELREPGRTQPQRIAGLTCGTREGYDKYGCRCDQCDEAKRRHNSRVYTRRRVRLGLTVPDAPRRHAFCVFCARGLMHFDTQRDRQRLWKQAYDQGVPWETYQAACRAVFEAIAAWGKEHPPPINLKMVALLARREKKVIYVIGHRCTTKRPIRGPFLEVWPSGNISAIGERQDAA